MGQADRQTDGQACKKKCTSWVSYIVIYVKLQPVVYMFSTAIMNGQQLRLLCKRGTINRVHYLRFNTE